MVETRHSDRDEDVGLALEFGRGMRERDQRRVAGRRRLGPERGAPHHDVGAPDRVVGRVSLLVVIRDAAPEADAERKAGGPERDVIGARQIVLAGERQAGRAALDVQRLDDVAGALDHEVAVFAKRRGAPDKHRIFRGFERRRERPDIRFAAGGRTASDERLQTGERVDEPALGNGQRLDHRALELRPRLVARLAAEEHEGARAVEEAAGLGRYALVELVERRRRIGTDHQHEVCVVADLGEGGRDPALALRGREVPEHAGRSVVVHAPAGRGGELQRGAHAFDVRAEAGVDRRARARQQLGRGRDGVVERGVPAVNARRGSSLVGAAEQRRGAAAHPLARLDRRAANRQRHVVASKPAERAHNVLMRHAAAGGFSHTSRRRSAGRPAACLRGPGLPCPAATGPPPRSSSRARSRGR